MSNDKTISFTKPVFLLRCISNFRQIPKQDRALHPVKDILTLPQSVLSNSGYIEKEILYLNEKFSGSQKDFQNAGMIILTEFLKDKSIHMNHIDILSDMTFPRKFSLYKLQIVENQLEISLNYSENKALIGQPRRADFKLAELNQGEAVRITFNSKNDLYRQRHFLYFDDLFMDFLPVHGIEFLPPSKIKRDMPLPITFSNHVKLLKTLY